MAVDGYNQTYDAGETSEVSIDLIVGVLASLVGFATLIGLIMLYGWLKKRIGKVGI